MPWTGRPHVRSCKTIKSTLLEGQAARPPWLQCFAGCCGVVALFSWRHEIVVCNCWYKNNLEKRITMLLSGPPWRAPHQYIITQTVSSQMRGNSTLIPPMSQYYEDTNIQALPGYLLTNLHIQHPICTKTTTPLFTQYANASTTIPFFPSLTHNLSQLWVCGWILWQQHVLCHFAFAFCW